MNATVRESDILSAVPALSTRPLTVAEIRRIAIDALMMMGNTRLSTLHQIEKITDPEVRDDTSVAGTVIEPIVTALNRRGMQIQLTYGGARDALDLDDGEMHLIFCDCNSGARLECKLAGQMIGIVPMMRKSRAIMVARAMRR